jgi:RNA polymerase sigma-32 factor
MTEMLPIGTGGAFMLNLPNARTSLKAYILEVNRLPLLNSQEEFELAVRYRKHSDPEAGRQLILSNLRFVVKIAFEYRSYGMDLLDLIQEGNMGLIRMVDKFDPYKGYRFISYAVWWIRAYIQNFIIRNWSLVKIGTTQAQRKLFYKIGKIRKALGENQQGFEEGYELLARELDVAKEEIAEIEQRMSSKDISLDTPFDDDRELTHLEFLHDDSPNQEEVIAGTEEHEILGRRIRDLLNGLNRRERYVLKKRILGDARMTLEDIGKRLNLSKERVRQIELEALNNLRRDFVEGTIRSASEQG